MSRRLREGLKTLTLLLLLLSAGVLCWKNWFSGGVPADGETSAALPDVVDCQAAAQPLTAGVFWREGGYGASFQAGGVSLIMDLWGDLLGECLSAAGPVQACGEEQWRETLSGSGVYLCYQAALPLEALCLWQGYAPADTLEGQLAQRVFLAEGEDGFLLYFCREDGRFFCETGAGRSERERLSTELIDNGAALSFREGEECLVLPGEVVRPALESLPASLGEEMLTALVRPFRLSAYSNNRYTGQEGAQVFVEGARTLRLETDGRGVYQDRGTGEGERLLAAVSEEGAAPAEKIEAVRGLAERVLDPFLGDAALGLSGYEERGGETLIRFQLLVDGVPVYDGQPAFEARLEEGVVTQASFLLRGYRRTGETVRAMPLPQAAAASGGRLTLWYLRSENGWELSWTEEKE